MGLEKLLLVPMLGGCFENDCSYSTLGYTYEDAIDANNDGVGIVYDGQLVCVDDFNEDTFYNWYKSGEEEPICGEVVDVKVGDEWTCVASHFVYVGGMADYVGVDLGSETVEVE